MPSREQWGLWDNKSSVFMALLAICGAVGAVWRWGVPRWQLRRARADEFYRNALRVLIHGQGFHQFVRTYWRYGKPLRNYPLEQPIFPEQDSEMYEHARKALNYYQRFCNAQGDVGGSPDQAVQLWEQIHQPLRAALEARFKKYWPLGWRGRWSQAEAESRLKAAGPLQEQELAIAEGRQ